MPAILQNVPFCRIGRRKRRFHFALEICNMPNPLFVACNVANVTLSATDCIQAAIASFDE